MGQLWAHKMTIGGVYLCPMDIIWPFILYLLYLYFSELCFLCYYFSLFLLIGSITDLLMRCDPSNGYILLYTCGPGTNSFSHASVYLVKEKVLSLVLINEHVHVWKSWWGHASSTAGVRTWLNSNMQENSTHHQTRCSSIWLCGHSTNMFTNGMTAMTLACSWDNLLKICTWIPACS